MRTSSHRWWFVATALLTILLLAIVFPILCDKYGPGSAIALSCLLPVGMVFYYLRGVMLARPKR
jgi:hypothetical protein